MTDMEFADRFTDEFGYVCSVCDSLWYKRDIRGIPDKSIAMLTDEFPLDDVTSFKVCQTCYKSLNDTKIPRLSKCNGFKYPEFPSHLLPLDVITEHLVSPRLPFMQRRRLRRVYGSKSIIGQVVNIPVNVNNMVNALPRQLDDHRAF